MRANVCRPSRLVAAVGAGLLVAAGEGSVWALTRQPTPALWRIDPSSNRVVGGPTPLPADPWSLGVGPGRCGWSPGSASTSGRTGSWPPATACTWPTPTAAAVWSNATAHDDRVVRIDPATLAVTQTFHLGGNVSAVAFGSLWATAQPGLVVRLTRPRAVD